MQETYASQLEHRGQWAEVSRKEHTVAGRMTRRGYLLTLVAGTGMALAACDPLRPAADQASTAPVTIEFWISRAEATPEAKVVGDLNQQFMSTQRRIKVTSVYGKSGTLPNLTPAYVAGTPPAGVQNSGPQVWGFSGNDIMKPLNEFMRKDRVTTEAMKDFYPAVHPAFTWRGKQLYFCTDVSMEIWMINLDYFRRAGVQVPRPGWTWSEVEALSAKLRSVVPPVSEHGYPFMVELPTLWRTLHWVHQNDSDLLDKDQTKIIIDDLAWIEVHNHLRDMWRKEIFGRSKIRGEGDRLSDSKLWHGKHAAELEGMTRIPAYRKEMAEIGYMPSMTKKKRSAVFDSWVEGVINHPDAKHQQAAYELIAWHIRPENLAIRLRGTGNLPPRKAVLTQPVFQDAMASEPLQKQALDELNYARTFPMSPITLDIRVRVQQATQEIVIEGKPAKESLEQARKELDFKWQTEVLPKLK